MTMKAIWYEQSGEAETVLIHGEKDSPAVGDGEVLIRLHASAVNPSDVKKRSGAQPAEFDDGFIIPHSDGAGIIEAVGNGVNKNRIGKRVWVYQAQFGRHMGTAAEYVSLPSNIAPNLPENTSYEIGACIGIPIMTAHRAVFIHGDVAGKIILVTGASGRVGYYATQFAKSAGATVIATAGSEGRCDAATKAGADKVLNYRSVDLVAEIDDFTEGQGVDHIIDVEFGVNAEVSAKVLKNCGSIATYSSSQAAEPIIPFYPLMFKNITINMILVYNMPDSAKQKAQIDIHRALEKNQLDHRIAGTWPLIDTAKAHAAIEAGGLDGCAVINIE